MGKTDTINDKKQGDFFDGKTEEILLGIISRF